MIIYIGNITPETNNVKIPKLNPKISPFVLNYAVIMFRYPNIMKSKNPSIDIDSIGSKDKFFDKKL